MGGARPFIMNRGKHYGRPISEVPADYLEWMVRSTHDLAPQAEAEIKRRREAQNA